MQDRINTQVIYRFALAQVECTGYCKQNITSLALLVWRDSNIVDQPTTPRGRATKITITRHQEDKVKQPAQDNCKTRRDTKQCTTKHRTKYSSTIPAEEITDSGRVL